MCRDCWDHCRRLMTHLVLSTSNGLLLSVFVHAPSNFFDGVFGAALLSLPLPLFAPFPFPLVRASIMYTSIKVAPVAASRDS